MVVLDDTCEKCNKKCNAIHFQRNFKNWTSGNNNIDKFIQDTQLSVHWWDGLKKTLEWIPCNRFYDIKYIAEGEFGKVYRANWIDGPIDEWEGKNQNWKRDQNKSVTLESLNHSKNITLEFMNEVLLIYNFENLKILIFTNRIIFIDYNKLWCLQSLRNNSRSRNKKLYDCLG
jgi:hypothetical protein